ncbi:motility associated factor glycosyltransferase family protein [Saliterribacillus persicus]|uniref:Motility associated factor glycosyltransferase family protein n=1 Tax=Saliterribacillus persicus TaxID=930114 RepID=A0A368Y371_9BACI|nr:6-hydroxymethylpterin diphosphokinase MptE-like protein [Saliterribacillus persicus]RCW74721.1 hypothetical protein DFR57_10317 [Saliterribacillus persicus]
MLIENRNYLRLQQRSLIKEIDEVEINRDKIVVENARKGMPTLVIKNQSRTKYLHSKYDPYSEAERIVKSVNLKRETKHVILFGVGLGYHIIELLKKYPTITMSIYEPDRELLATFLKNFSLESIEKGTLSCILPINSSLSNELAILQQRYGNNIEVFPLPTYEDLFKKELEELYKSLITTLKNQKGNFVANVTFQKRWTINAVKNFPAVLNTPNIFKDINTNHFKDKPAIIVAAGPSLNKEFDNLKKIKEQGLAYIFSVGSAINALIENNIYPDAACTYDPSEHNQVVFEKLKDKQINDIPIIFGSTVGYETIENYPGDMVHMITSQDTVSAALLENSKEIDRVNDAPSIAVVTYQLLEKLGFTQVYLVGQNLAFLDSKMYAEGIEYGKDIDENNSENLLTVQDVEGNKIVTNEGYDSMRRQLEQSIASTPNVQVYNTTVGGAKIEGTSFILLSNVIDKHFSNHVVAPNWYKGTSNYNIDHVNKMLLKYKREQENLEKLLYELEIILEKLHSKINSNEKAKLENNLNKFDRVFKKMKNNNYYISFISPMIRVQTETLAEKSKNIKYDIDSSTKISQINQHFGKYIREVINHLEFTKPFYEDLIKSVRITQDHA